MALTRRQFLALVPVGAVACAHRGTSPGEKSLYKVLREVPGNAGARTVLVCMPDTAQTREVWTGLSDEIGGEFKLVAILVNDRNGASHIAEGISRHKPSAIVLMNNPTVSAYKSYRAQPGANTSIPAVVVMTSFVESESLRALGATGISYEVPLITVVTNLRKIVATPVERVAVIYRMPLASFMARQQTLAQREQTTVVRLQVSAAPNPSELKRAIRLAKQRADVLWILNDDRLLTPKLISDGWVPGLNERPWRPTIVGAASLVSAAQSLGTFAVLPDHTALGVQAANLVFQLADDGWRIPTESLAQQPLSTTTTIDLLQVQERFRLRQDALAQVDRIVD